MEPASNSSDTFSPSDAANARFMKSSWHQNPARRAIFKDPLAWLGYTLMYKGGQEIKSGKVPVHSVWTQHIWVLPRAVAPMLLQFVSMRYFNLLWPTWLAMLVYSIYLIIFASMMLLHMNDLAEKYGFLDSSARRDQIPDKKLTSTMVGLIATVTVRPIFGCMVAYDAAETPAISPWLPVHLFMYTLILDFWFYIYHRAMHEFDFLWKYHKTHHMTKHPNPMLSAFGDPEQDLFDVLVIPMLVYMTYPLDFYTWWICQVYTLYVEAAGHTGIRVVWPATTVYYPLKWFEVEHIIEDHDLHHRNGWKRSFNYGKQTRVWDTLFGTTRPGQLRVECTPDNIEW